MGLLWGFEYAVLLGEVILLLLLCMPMPDNRLRGGLLKMMGFIWTSRHLRIAVFVVAAITGLLFLDALRNVSFVGEEEMRERHDKGLNEHQIALRLFLNQRNCYISGFALFLMLVIFRLYDILGQLHRARAEVKQRAKEAGSHAVEQVKEKIHEAHAMDKLSKLASDVSEEVGTAIVGEPMKEDASGDAVEFVELGPETSLQEVKESVKDAFKAIVDAIPTWSSDALSIDEDVNYPVEEMQEPTEPQQDEETTVAPVVESKSLFHEIQEVDPLFELPDKANSLYIQTYRNPDSHITSSPMTFPKEASMEPKQVRPSRTEPAYQELRR